MKSFNRRNVFLYGDSPSPIVSTSNAKIQKALLKALVGVDKYNVSHLSRFNDDIPKIINVRTGAAYAPVRRVSKGEYLQLPCKLNPDHINLLGNYFKTYGPCHYFIGTGGLYELSTQIGMFGLNEKAKYAAYIPMDTDGMPNNSDQILKKTNKIITPTLFGKKVLERYGYEVEHIPGFVDTEAFKPLEEDKKKKVRERISVKPDEFLIFTYFTNGPSENGFAFLDAVYQFIEQNPKTKVVILAPNHDAKFNTSTGKFDKQMDYNLSHFARRTLLMKYPGKHYVSKNQIIFLGQCGNCRRMMANSNIKTCPTCEEAKQGLFDTRIIPGEGIPEQTLIELINAADLVCLTPNTIGWGLKLLEVQACGTPLIVSDVCGASELVCDKQSLIPVKNRFWFPGETKQGRVSENEVFLKLEQLHKDVELRKKMSEKGLEFVKEYDIYKFISKWREWMNNNPVPYNLVGKK